MRRPVLMRLAVAGLAAAALPFLVAAQSARSAGAADVQLQLGNLLFAEGRFTEALDATGAR